MMKRMDKFEKFHEDQHHRCNDVAHAALSFDIFTPRALESQSLTPITCPATSPKVSRQINPAETCVLPMPMPAKEHTLVPEFDAFSYLSGMVCGVVSGVNRDFLGYAIELHGGITDVDKEAIEEFPGESAVCAAIAKQAATQELVRSVRATVLAGEKSCVDKFAVDDWVLVNNTLASIVRFGYGQYEREIRVLGPQESTCDWTAGRWVAATSVKKLALPVPCRASRQALSADDPGVPIQKGATGFLTGFDKDGDMRMMFDAGAGHLHLCVFIQDAVLFEFG